MKKKCIIISILAMISIVIALYFVLNNIDKEETHLRDIEFDMNNILEIYTDDNGMHCVTYNPSEDIDSTILVYVYSDYVFKDLSMDYQYYNYVELFGMKDPNNRYAITEYNTNGNCVYELYSLY